MGELAAGGREALHVHDEGPRRLEDGELLLCRREHLAPEEVYGRTISFQNERVGQIMMREERPHARLALVLVRPVELVDLDELVERLSEGVALPDLDADVEAGIEGVGRLPAALALDTGPQTAAVELMNRCGVLELNGKFPGGG